MREKQDEIGIEWEYFDDSRVPYTNEDMQHNQEEHFSDAMTNHPCCSSSGVSSGGGDSGGGSGGSSGSRFQDESNFKEEYDVA
jgi:hypothetical protein